MVSDSELLTRLREILGASDLDTATAGSVRRELEKHFGVDLSDRKAFIRDQIDIYLDAHAADNDDAAAENAEEEEDDDAEVDAEQNDDVKEEEGEEEEENGSNSKRRKTPKKVDKGVVKKGGFNILYSLSPQLQEVVGEPKMSRGQVVKKMWDYIREKDLQDPKDRRTIICDEPLHALFRVKSINMFKMSAALSKHIWRKEDVAASSATQKEPVKKKKKGEESDVSVSDGDASKEEEQEEEEEEEGEEREEVEGKCSSNRKQTKKRRSAKVDKEVKKKGGGGGFSKLSCLSPELQKFTGVSVLARTQVVKKLWDYIRENNLQDPKDRRIILCDEPLRTLFDVESINMFQMNKALSKHIFPLTEEALNNASQMEKHSEEEQEEDPDEPDQEEKRLKGDCQRT